MSVWGALSDDMSDGEWLTAIREIAADQGSWTQLGPRHGAARVERSSDVLLVCFDSVATARKGSSSGIPHGMLHAEMRGWSYISMIADGNTWFRASEVHAYFDALADDGELDAYRQVVFYGVGMGGYAAAAYSVAAPGATVLAVTPQATLEPRLTSWDNRFAAHRRLDFTGSYGFAPSMVDAAAQVFVICDPHSVPDAMHAAMFHAPHVVHVPFRFGGPRIGETLQDMHVMGSILQRAASGRLVAADIHRALRRRRDHDPYLRRLLRRVFTRGGDALTGILCRAVLDRGHSPRFAHHLRLSESRLDAAGRRLPPRAWERAGAASRARLN